MFTESSLAVFLAIAGAFPVSLLVLYLLVFKLPIRTDTGLADANLSDTGLITGPIPQDTFLFQGEFLINHDTHPDGLFSKTAVKITDWCAFQEWLGGRFGPLPDPLKQTSDMDGLRLSSGDDDDSAFLLFKCEGGMTRVILHDAQVQGAADRHEALNNYHALQDHALTFHEVPCGICVTSDSGGAVLQNTAFRALPPEEKEQICAITGQNGPERISIQTGEEEEWREVYTTEKDGRRIHIASDVSRIVAAERTQKQFVQTLTKTFANLTVGLALFDRNRQLALFNPALIDLTGLTAEFLIARPSLMSFFDNLRDRQVMPEPKNYDSWRSQITGMIESASDGFYQEIWTPPSGLTYRVTGRPHPDGAVAFLFEDISDDISMTRRFRAQLDIRQSVLDALPMAVAVISSGNVLLMCNTHCAALLKIDPDNVLVDMSLNDILAICRKEIPGDAFWSDVAEKITTGQLSAPVVAELTDQRNQRLSCTVTPISGGAVMLSFAASADVALPIPERATA